MYIALISVIYLAFVSLGLPDSLLGAAWPLMHQSFHVSLAMMGVVSMMISFSTIVSSLFANVLFRFFKTSTIVVASVFLTGVALFGFSLVNSFVALLLIAIPYGLGAGAIDVALNNYVAQNFSSKHMSWLHCFWGVGAMISPFIMSFAMKYASWQAGYRITSYIQIIITLILVLTLPLWKASSSSTNEDVVPVSLFKTIRKKNVVWLAFGFFAYCAGEASAMGWASTYFHVVKKMSVQTSAAYASLIFIGITLGRFLAGYITDLFGDKKMIELGLGVSVLALLCVMFARSDTLILAAFFLLGFGFSPIYPCIIHATPSLFGKESSASVIGILTTSAYIGNTFMPPLYGFLGKYVGYRILPYYVMLFMGIVFFTVKKTFRQTNTAQN